MAMGTEQEKVVHLVGSPENPAREPRRRPPTGKGSIGDTAFMDAVIVLGVCWLILLGLMYSLRSHNI